MKKIISICLCAIMLFSLVPSAFADETPAIYLNGTLTSFDTPPVCDDGVWMLPFIETMGKMGVEVNWDKDWNDYRGYIGDIPIGVTPDKNTAVWDYIPFETQRTCKTVGDDIMIEADFFNKVYDSKVSISDSEIRISLDIPKDDGEGALDVDAYLAGIQSTDVFTEDQLATMTPRDPQFLTQEMVDVEGMHFDKALHLHSNEKRDLSYEIQVSMSSDTHLYMDDICVLTVWLRTDRTQHESGQAKIGFNHEKKVTWTKPLSNEVTIPAQGWFKYQVVYRIIEELVPGNHQLNFVIGYYNQDLEIGGLSVKSYGQRIDTNKLPLGVVGTKGKGIYEPGYLDYYGREEGALWREEALKRIDEIRVRDINVNITDENGKPVEGATAEANMTRSEFGWGAMVSAGPMINWLKDSTYYQSALTRLFNGISEGNIFKYGGVNEIEATWAVNFAEANNMYLRCHNVVWDDLGFLKDTRDPERLNDWIVDADSTEDEVFEHFANHASWMMYNFGDKFDEIDVVNEPIAWYEFSNRYGRQWMADVIKLVDDIVPDVPLIVNDFGITGDIVVGDRPLAVKRVVDELIEMGAPVDGVGVEGHPQICVYPQLIYNQYDVLAENVDMLTVTEWDMPLSTTQKLEEIQTQAEFLRDNLIITYSHPKAIAFHLWGFTDLNHNLGNGPFYDYFYTPRPALQYWKDLVLGEWFTQTSATSDANGKAAMRGHRGEYDITVTANGKTAKTTLKVTDKGENTVNAVVTADGIALTSSELVPEHVYNEIETTAVHYTWDDTSVMWKQMYENKTSSVVGANGESIDFLKEKDNTALYSIDGGQSVTALLDTPMESGVVKITMPQTEGKSFIYEVKARLDDGEWLSLGRSDSIDPKYLHFDTKINQVKICGADGETVQLGGIHISEKEKIRE